MELLWTLKQNFVHKVMTRTVQDSEIWLVCGWEKLLFTLAELFSLALSQVEISLILWNCDSHKYSYKI